MGTMSSAWAIGGTGLGVIVSTRFFSSTGTPTLATLAPTMKASAAATRHLYCQR
jgi:hypothetical protein